MFRIPRFLPAAFFALAFLAFFESTTSAQKTPDFVNGDLDRLSCKVLKGQDAGEDLVFIEVRNKGKVSAEPLVFELKMKPKKAGVDLANTRWEGVRIGAPSYGRAGRALKPNAKLVYLVARPWTNREDVRFEVRVTEASFFRGNPILKSPVKILKTREVKLADQVVGRVTATQVRLENKLPMVVDVILRVTLAGGGRESLALERLLPKEKRWVGQGMEDSQRELRAPPVGARSLFGHCKSVKVEDWSVIVDSGEDRAMAALKRAWDRQARWPAGDLTVQGEVEYAIKGVGLAPTEGKTTFSLTRAAEAGSRLKVTTGLEGDVSKKLAHAIYGSFEHLDSPDFESLMQVYRVETVRLFPRPAFELHWRDLSKMKLYREFRVFEIEDDRIVSGQGGTRMSAHALFDRTNELLPDERVVPKVERRISRIQNRELPVLSLALRHGVTEGYAHPVEATFKTYQYSKKDIDFEVVLDFGKLRFEGAIAPPRPAAGAALDRVRAAWEKPYRYPASKLDLRGRFQLLAPTTSANWENKKELKGRFEFDQWSGRGGDVGQVFGGLRVKFARKPPLADAKVLEDLLRARYSIWARHDFAGRRSFDATFLDAVLEPDPIDDSRVIVTGHPIKAFILKDGIIRRIEFQNGLMRDLEWSEVKGRLVAARVVNRSRDYESTLDVTFAEPVKGHLFPETIDVRGWFDKDWHETYLYRGAKVRRGK